MSEIRIKICGLSTPETVRACANAGANMVGFVFFAKSPRNVDPLQAKHCALTAPSHMKRVGLFVEPDDETLRRILASVPIDIIQVHDASDPYRISGIRSLTGKLVYAAVGIAGKKDLENAAAVEHVADGMFYDAKAPKESHIPGGRGVAFDWTIMRNHTFSKPWLLAGGLNSENVAEAVMTTGAPGVDVSSGVESSVGQKDPAKINAFIKSVRAI